MKQLNSKLVTLIDLLNDQAFHTGIKLGKQLQVSRTAIWKMITKLVDYQIPIIRSRTSGYALKEPLTLLNRVMLKKALAKFNIHQLSIFESIPSTQAYLSHQPIRNNSFNICLAEMQTQGRGRFNRLWYSPFGQNIYLSISTVLKKDLSQLNGLPIVIALSLANALNNNCHLKEPILIKWPNDLIYNQRKLSGILVEVFAEAHGFSKIIIGIGVNINLKNQEKMPIDQLWTSLYEITGCYYDRNILLSAIIPELIKGLVLFESKGLLPFLPMWHKRDYLYGKRIWATTESTSISGKAMGITDHGCLKIQQDNHEIMTFSVGDISLHKGAKLSN
jgi:BirA family biotin operon repressor/biotin-[acetyl-CoA-carboxylase] ligase